MAITPFLKLQKPPFDTIPWDDALNGNMDILDAFISNYMAVPNYVGVLAEQLRYIAGQNVLGTSDGLIYTCLVSHVSATSPTTFVDDRAAHPSYWVQTLAGSFPVSVYASTASMNAAVATALNNFGRNRVHNPLFAITQKGVGPQNVTGYITDRWRLDLTLDATSVAINAATDGDRAAIGDEEVRNFMVASVVGNAGATALTVISQPIEGVRRLAGKVVTVSFWAQAGSGAKVGVGLQQNFGTGGSPSTQVILNAVPITLTGAFVRYSVSMTLPSIAGKTFGSNNDDFTSLSLYLSSGATNNTIAGGIGVQTANFGFWGIQLEVGPTMTQLEKLSPSQDLANCQRFYQAFTIDIGLYGPAGGGVWQTVSHLVTMRATPTANTSGGVNVNVTSFLITALSASSTRLGFIVTALGAASWGGGATLILNADLNP